MMLDTRGLIPIAVGCTPGSGSRVVRNILTTSPSIYMDRDVSAKQRDSLETESYVSRAGQPAAITRPLIRAFVSSLLAQVPEGTEGSLRYFGWKRPQNLLFIDELLAVHRELRFLHLVRDPAAMTRSRRRFREHRERGDLPPRTRRRWHMLDTWAKENLAAWEKHSASPRYYLVRYEALIQQPEQTIRGIFSWLDLTDYDLDAALAFIDPPADAISRGDGIRVSRVAEACRKLGYGHRLEPAPALADASKAAAL